MLLLTGALVSGFLGYRQAGWWAPTAVTFAVLALEAVTYQGMLSTGGGMGGLVQVLVMTGLTCLFLFHAMFSMGRSLGLRRSKRRQ
jgi:hypothetical protein